MEAEELEELNPSIKGKRLQVVDEVFVAYVFVHQAALAVFASRLLLSNPSVVVDQQQSGYGPYPNCFNRGDNSAVDT